MSKEKCCSSYPVCSCGSPPIAIAVAWERMAGRGGAMSKYKQLAEAKRILTEENARKIARAARESLQYYYERTQGETVPAFVITRDQRIDLMVGPLDPYVFEPGAMKGGPDLLYGVPCFITADKSWPCPTNLIDLRRVEC